jgi:hypothetical protein
MNTRTKKIVEFIDSNEKYNNKIIELKQKYNNSKDFFDHMLKYVIMDILNTQKQFFDFPRNEIQLDEIVRRYGK